MNKIVMVFSVLRATTGAVTVDGLPGNAWCGRHRRGVGGQGEVRRLMQQVQTAAGGDAQRSASQAQSGSQRVPWAGNRGINRQPDRGQPAH